jgi:hypothetical protein
MGVALYRADFLYPTKKKEVVWFEQEDVGPYIERGDVPTSLKK